MDGFFEILHPADGHVIQRLAVLLGDERDQLEARGYRVVKRSLDRRLWRWLIDDES